MGKRITLMIDIIALLLDVHTYQPPHVFACFYKCEDHCNKQNEKVKGIS